MAGRSSTDELVVDGRVLPDELLPRSTTFVRRGRDRHHRAPPGRGRARAVEARDGLAGGAVTVPDVARVAVEEARAAFETDGAAVCSCSKATGGVCSSRARPDARRRKARFALLPLGAPRPAAEAARGSRSRVRLRRPGHGGAVPGAHRGCSSRRRRWGAPADRLRGDDRCAPGRLRPSAALAADERDLLEAIAGQTAVALERAQLYEREHTVAQTLQASLLPRALPRRPGRRPGGAAVRGGRSASRSAVTSTTRSRSVPTRGGSRSATSAARASTPRR